MDTFCPNICFETSQGKTSHDKVMVSNDLKSDFVAKSEIHSQTPEYLKLNVLNEDKRKSHH